MPVSTTLPSDSLASQLSDPAPTFRFAWTEISSLSTLNPALTAYMRIRAASGASAGSRLWVRLQEISPFLLCAVVAAEDPLFFSHHGIWWQQLWRVVRRSLPRRQPIRGVSTITQQLARNLYLKPTRTVSRKIQEALLALRLERALTKERILEIYLNVVELGDAIWGVGAAARAYFDVGSADLDPFQAVFLASLLPAPRATLVGGNLERVLRSQRGLLFSLYGSGAISLDEERETIARIAQLERGLRSGATLDECLAAIAQSPFPYSAIPNGHSRPTVADLVASGCARSQQSAYNMFCIMGGYPPAWVNERPAWWAPGH